MDYKWKCSVCGVTNAKQKGCCIGCHSAAELSSIEIAERKREILNGTPIDDRGMTVLDARTQQGIFIARAVNISMGQSVSLRKAGLVLWYATILLVALSLAYAYLTQNRTTETLFSCSIFALVASYDINNFVRGKNTYMGQIDTRSVRTNTGARWFGAFIDLLVLVVSLSFLIDF